MPVKDRVGGYLWPDWRQSSGGEHVVALVSRPPTFSPVAVDGLLQLGGTRQVLHVTLVGIDIFGISERRGRDEHG